MSTPLPHEPQRAIDPTRESFKALFERAPAQGPVQMLNLLAFKDTAEDGGRTGRQAYAEYSKAARAVSPARRRLPASMNSFDQV